MRQRFDVGSALVVLGALVLLASLFLRWYGRSASAFDAFEVVDWLLVALSVAALVGALRGAEGGSAPAAWLPWVTLAALGLVLAELIDPPPAVRGTGREVGAWLALAAAAVAAAGSVALAAAISVTVDVRGRERRRLAALDRREPSESAAPPTGARAGAAAAGRADEPGTEDDRVDERRAQGERMPAPDPERTQQFQVLDAPRAPGERGPGGG